MKQKTDYSYTKSEFTNQYETEEYREEIVDAKYVQAGLEADRGNPLIEALPPVRTKEEISEAYSVAIPGFFRTDFSDKDAMDCIDAMNLLKSARVEIPYHEDVEVAIHSILVMSYRNRTLRRFRLPFSAQEDEPEETEILLTSDCLDTKDNAVRVLGDPGTGKSACMDIARNRYPIAIRHSFDGCEFIQIPLLYVTCPPNSNFKALFKSIAEAVDRALGYGKPFYKAQMDNKKLSVDDLAEKVCDLIEEFGIGAIILDETQLLDLARQTAGTDNALLKIINTTCVGFIFVGTKDALDRLSGELHLARRMGKLIDTDKYCKNRDFFGFLMTWLSGYQWTKKKARLTPEITNAMYRETGGIIDMVISLWMCMQTEIIATGNSGVITDGFVRDVAERFYPGFRDVIEKLGVDNDERHMRYITMRQSADRKMSEIQAEVKSRRKASEIIDSMTEDELRIRDAKKDNAVMLLKSTLDVTGKPVSDKRVTSIVNAVMADKAFSDAAEKDIAQEAFRRLAAAEPAKAKPKRKKAKSGSQTDIMITENLRQSAEV